MSGVSEDPIVIDEVVNIDTEHVEVKYGTQKNDFASVVFHNIAETYPEDAHIECRYTVTSDLIPTTRDWVGLYKVGWMNPRDYLYYEWAPVPKEYKVGCDAEASVLFPAHQLPKDDGEFYQFCYVSSSSQIRGASTPFQFRHPGAEEYVEIEDEETNMLVIRSKTVFLQENLQQAEAQKYRLIEAQETLQKERDDLVSKYQDLKKKVSSRETECAQATSKLTEREAQIKQLNKEAKDMMLCREELEAKIDKLKQERTTLEQSITSLTSKISSLMAEKKTLEGEKDQLAGENVQLEEQVNIYKEHFSTSESSSDKLNKMTEEQKLKLVEQGQCISVLKEEICQLQDAVAAAKSQLHEQNIISEEEQERMAELEERVKNAEDKLQAAEESKIILQSEIGTYEETQSQLSRQIEKSKTECEGLKKKLVCLEEDFTQKNKILECEMEQTKADFMTVLESKEELQGENARLQQQVMCTQEVTDTSKGSMSIMKQSLTQIKERLEKKEKHCRSLETRLRTREHEILQTEHDLRREIEDLKEKIYMCSEEYKTLYLEKNKLKKKLAKSKVRPMKQMSTESTVEMELTQQACSTPLEASVGEPSTPCDLEMQVEDFERELDSRLAKKLKYKNLFKQEREKVEEIKRQSDVEIKEKDEEIDRLKKRIKDLPNNWDLKLRALEKCVTEKEGIIEELNQKLRICNQGRNDETGASTLPQRTMGPPTDTKYIGYMTYGPGQGYPYGAAPTTQPPMYYPNTTYPYPQHGPVQYPQQGPPPPLVYPRQQQQPLPPVLTYPYPGAESQQGAGSSGDLKYPVQRETLSVNPGERLPAQRVQTATETEVDKGVEITILKERSASGTSDDILDEAEPQPVTLDKPLTPLPPPLVPEVLPSAKVAAVKSSIKTASGGVDEPDAGTDFVDYISETDLKVTLPHRSPTAPPTEQKEDRFYDAVGISMKICPECNMTFPADVTEDAFEEHQLSHIVGICPVCKMMKNESMSDDDFARHVNKHYEEDDGIV